MVRAESRCVQRWFVISVCGCRQSTERSGGEPAPLPRHISAPPHGSGQENRRTHCCSALQSPCLCDGSVNNSHRKTDILSIA